MHRPQEQVRDFHRACNIVRPNRPQIIDCVHTSGKLIEEELQEFKDAIAARNLPLAAGELCDLLYATYGAAVALGIDLEPFFEEVQRANMEKASGPKREDGKQLKPEGWRKPDLKGVFIATYNRRA